MGVRLGGSWPSLKAEEEADRQDRARVLQRPVAMRTLRWTSLATGILATSLLAGCITAGPGYYPDDDPADGYNPDRGGSIEGTVTRVSPVDHRIVVSRSDRYDRGDLRNSRDDPSRRNGNDGEMAFYYDDRTEVEYAGRTYRPQDLEQGDRIRADVAEADYRLIATQIEVLYDVSSGSPAGGYEQPGDRDGYDRGEHGDRDDRGARGDRGGYDDRHDGPGGVVGPGGGVGDADRATELRGTVRSVDPRARTFEVDTTGYDTGYDNGSSRRRAELVVVRYDGRTIVEFQGQTSAPEGGTYNPESLERGDVVTIQAHEVGGDRPGLLAERISVVGESQPVR